MKFSKYLILILCLGFLCSFAPVRGERLNIKESDSKDYLINHGYSPEIVRLIKLQEVRTVGKKRIEDNNKFVKLLKNLYYERDLTMPLNDFGHNEIITPEAPSYETLPQFIQNESL